MEAYTGEIKSVEQRIADYSDHGYNTCGDGQPLQCWIRLIFAHGLHLQLVVHNPLDQHFSRRWVLNEKGLGMEALVLPLFLFFSLQRGRECSIISKYTHMHAHTYYSCTHQRTHTHTHTDHNPNAMFVRTTCGGHLGFFEGGVVIPHPTSWVDRLILEYSQSCINLREQ